MCLALSLPQKLQLTLCMLCLHFTTCKAVVAKFLLYPGTAVSAIDCNIKTSTKKNNHISDNEKALSIMAKLLCLCQHHETKSKPPVTRCNSVDPSRSFSTFELCPGAQLEKSQIIPEFLFLFFPLLLSVFIQSSLIPHFSLFPCLPHFFLFFLF